MIQKISETEIAKPVVGHLQNLQWEVFQEVTAPGGIADIVARFNNLIWVIECKTTFGFKVVEQAERWTRYAHFVSVAVPHQSGQRSDFGRRICQHFGIGIFGVFGSTYLDDLTEPVKARFNRRAYSDVITKRLFEEQKTFAMAGTDSGKRWTPFQATCRNIRDYVQQHQGCSLKELIENIETHYRRKSTAKNCIPSYLEKGIVNGVRIERTGKRISLYTSDAPSQPQESQPSLL